MAAQEKDLHFDPEKDINVVGKIEEFADVVSQIDVDEMVKQINSLIQEDEKQ